MKNVQVAQHEYVESLTRWEWIWFGILLVPMAALMSFNAMYQGFKVGQFEAGGTIAMVIVWPVIWGLVCRNAKERAVHVANHFQTAVAGAASSVGMGSMLLAYQWAAKHPLSGVEVSAIAFPMSLFGIYAAQLFGETWINRQKLTFVGGVASGALLNGLGEGGNALKLLLAGLGIALPLTVWESPWGAATMAIGWIVGWEICGWAMLSALICSALEPTLIDLGYIKTEYRQVTIYFGACIILAAGVIDMLFAFFMKTDKGDNPHFTEREGFLSKPRNIAYLVGLAALMAIGAEYFFGLSWYLTMGVCGMLVVLIYVGGTCSGKAGISPVSALSGTVIISVIAGGLGSAQALIFGAGAGQALSNGMDAGHDLRAGERVGSSLKLQRFTQAIGAALGGSIIVGAMYSFFMAAFGDKLTHEAVDAKNPMFNAGFALKYEGFTKLLDKLKSMEGLGEICLWVVIATAGLTIIKNLLKFTGKFTASRLVPSPYGIAMAMFIPFTTTQQMMAGAAIAAVLLLVWNYRGTPVTVQTAHGPSTDRVFLRLNWQHMVCIPCGLMVGEAILSFIDGCLNIFGHSGLITGEGAEVSKIVVSAIVVLGGLYLLRKIWALGRTVQQD